MELVKATIIGILDDVTSRNGDVTNDVIIQRGNTTCPSLLQMYLKEQLNGKTMGQPFTKYSYWFVVQIHQ